MGEADIDELIWIKFLNYSQGVMIFEKMEWDKSSPPPFGKKEDARKFYQNIEKRLDAIWTMLFPYSGEHKEDVREAALVFKAQQEKRKAGK